MNYNRIAATAKAARYIEQRDAQTRLEVERRISPSGNKMMACGLTCQEWMDIYLKRNLPAKVVEQNTEATNDDEDRGSVAGTEAGPGGAGEGVGDAASTQDGGREIEKEDGQARSEVSNVERNDLRLSAHADTRLDDPGNEASWIDEAYPEGSEGADFTEADRTPF